MNLEKGSAGDSSRHPRRLLWNSSPTRGGLPGADAMARAFGQAVAAGRLAFEAGLMPPRDMAVPSTPVLGMADLGLGGLR